MGGHSLRRAAVAAAGVLLLGSCARSPAPPAALPNLIGGPLGTFLTSSADLGPSRGHPVQLTVALHNSTRPQALLAWAQNHDLTVRWRPGDNFAYVEGAPDKFGTAFGISVHDFRSADGQLFYASKSQPDIPAPVRVDVAELGRVLSYHPTHLLRPPTLPLDVPNSALTPAQLNTTYNATPLRTTGKGQTIVFFEIDRYDQSDFDKFTSKFHLPQLKPTVLGKEPKDDWGETPMDLQVAHGIAPDAKKVIIYFPNENVPFQQAYEDDAKAFEEANRKFPGAIWSLSLGAGCDMIDRAADLAPLRAAISAAQRNGTTVFISAGDTGGYECKGYGITGKPDKYTAPTEDEIGLSSYASLPEVTGVGGTTLSTDNQGGWVTEAGWADYPMTQGTGGGISNLFARPDWQSAVTVTEDVAASHPSAPDVATHRLTPDIAADADPATGVLFCYKGKGLPGGGTSQSAPIWAALTALMNQYLVDRGGHPVGDLNPLLYRVAASGARPALHDVSFGGNAAYNSGAGFDLATGLGTPDTLNLVNDILDIQKAGG